MRSCCSTLWLVVALGLAACTPLDTTRQAEPRPSMGAILYQEVCQRVAYTSELEEQQRGEREIIDVNGEKYRATCWRGAAPPEDAPLTLKALTGQREPMVTAVDLILPEALLPAVRSFFDGIVVLSEDGTNAEVADKFADVLLQLRDDAEVATALSRLGYRGGYRPLQSAVGVLSAALSYPGMDSLLDKLLALIAKDGPAEQEFRDLTAALSYELRSLESCSQPADPERTLRLAVDFLFTTSEIFVDGLMRPLTSRDWRGLAQVNLTDGKVPPPFVDTNHDGLPDTDADGRFIGSDGKPLDIGAPFPVPGEVDQHSRDALGRLVGKDGQLIYRYRDLDATVLKGALSEMQALMDPTKDMVIGLLDGAAPLLGTRLAKTKRYDLADGAVDLEYLGFDERNSAILDLAHGLFQLLADPEARNLLTLVKTLFSKYESDLARVLKAVLDVSDRAKHYPDALVPAASTLYDDLAVIIVRVLQVPGLLQDLLDALEDPHAKGLARLIGYEMRYRDRFILDQNTLAVHGTWTTPVDHGATDADNNRSLFQRMAHLIHDANGTRFCNKNGATVTLGDWSFGNFAECEMFRVDDLALFFILSMADHSVTSTPAVKASRYETTYSKASFLEQITSPVLYALLPDGETTGHFTDSLLEGPTGTNIPGFTRFPTPAAAARSLFIDQAHKSAFLKNATDAAVCNEGDRFLDVHNDSIFVWEAPVPGNPSGFAGDSFYDGVRPLITAFAKHDECIARGVSGNCLKWQNAAKIFLDLMSVLHHHWGTPSSTYFGHSYQSTNPNSPRYSAGDSVVTYEPILAEALIESDLMLALLQLVPVLNTTTIDGTPATPRAFPSLEETLHYVFDATSLPAPLAYRDGRTTAYRSDGVTVVGPVTPFYLLADAFARKRTAFEAASTTQQEAWRNAVSNLADQLLGTEAFAGGCRFKDRRVYGLVLSALDLFVGRLDAHKQKGDLSYWAHQALTADLTRALANPVVARLVDLAAKIEADGPARSELYGFLGYLFNTANGQAFSNLLTALADGAQLFFDDANILPLAHAVGMALDPERDLASALVQFVRRAQQEDPNCAERECVVVTLARNLFQDAGEGMSPVGRLGDVVAEVNRTIPGRGGHLDPQDYSLVFERVRFFLVDEERGFGKVVNLIKRRLGP